MKNIFKNNPFKLKENSDGPGFFHIYVHPCVIDNLPHIIYPRGLAEKSPGLFSRLKHYYQQQGYALKEDQRSGNQGSKGRHERRKWVPILLFTASLLFESSAFADVEVHVSEAALNQPQQQVELQLVSNQDIRSRIRSHIGAQLQQHALAGSAKQTKLNSPQADSLFHILVSRYQKQKNDPVYIIDDLKQVANYYSEFPEAVALLESIKDKNWKLSFDEDNWVTVGSGNMMQVEKAVIHFNTRSAAQLRLNNGCEDNPVCIASPADALLHELLHAYSMLVKSEEFIAQGGMNNVIYPYKHEYAVIEAERQLYATMSHEDHVQRPQRREHRGRMVKAHCPTCIK